MMKKINLKLFTALLAVALIAGVTIFYACEKENPLDLITPKKMISVPDELMKEPVIQEFLSQLAKYKISVNKQGIMEFATAREANEVLDLLQTFSDKFEEEVEYDDKYPRDPVLCAFEKNYDFYSLRRKIEEEIVALEQKDALTDKNDPDDHYVASTLMRTILTPECTFIYDKLICVHYDLFCIGIMDYDFGALQQIREIEKIPSTPETFENNILGFCNQSATSFIISSDFAQYVADFDIVPTKDPQTFKFTNKSYSEEYTQLEYLWDFGDGSTSTEKHPTHTFKNGESEVTLIIYKEGMVRHIKKQDVKSTCSASFTAKKSPTQNLQYTFTSTSFKPVDDQIIRYVWDFGDNTTEQSISPSITHTYQSSGVKTVTLTIYTYNQCSSTRKEQVYIEEQSVCCIGIDRDVEREIYYTYGGQKYAIKSILRVTNLFGFHRICTRVVHYKVKKNESRAETKTPTNGLGTRATGLINWADKICGEAPMNIIVEKPKDKKASRAQRDEGLTDPFRIDKHAIKGHIWCPAKSGNWELSGVALHTKKDC